MADLSQNAKIRFQGMDIEIGRSEGDGKLVISIDGPDTGEDALEDGVPDIRIWLNEALIYKDGVTGENLDPDEEY